MRSHRLALAATAALLASCSTIPTAPPPAAATLVCEPLLAKNAECVRRIDALTSSAQAGSWGMGGRAAISHGRLVVKIDEKPQVSQPSAFSRGQTAVTPSSQIDVQEKEAKVALFKPGASLSSLVDALNTLGTSPSDLVAILEALKQAGALKAEMVVI